MLNSLRKKALATLVVATAMGGLVPFGVAHAAADCHYVLASPKNGGNKYSCSSVPKMDHHVRAGRFFIGEDYTGDMLTIWMERPCRNDQKIDHVVWINNTRWHRNVRSIQPMGNCWIELYGTGRRDGPYDTQMADVHSIGGSTVTHVGLA